MQDLQNLETSRLVDLLAEQTELYLKISSQGSSGEEYVKCNLIMKALQKELEQRQSSKAETPTSLPDFSL